MKLILLSGGSGRRLWPLSNDVRSKQFLRLLPAPDGSSESMIQRVTRQIRLSGIADEITIATSQAQIDPIRSQLGTEGIEVVSEPSRRGTLPAIALACAALHDRGVSPDEPVVVIPCDVYADDSYFTTLKRMAASVELDKARIVLMGIPPKEPTSRFGYIVSKDDANACGLIGVERFVEKPDGEVARGLAADGALWNGGAFAFRLGYMLDLIKNFSDDISLEALTGNFEKIPATSFDKGVIEKERSLGVIPFYGEWKDLGSWDALSKEMPDSTLGYVVNSPSVRNTHVVNELDIPIVCVGVDSLIVSASPDGILIADKEASEGLKQHVAAIHARPMFEERRWGFYKVLGHSEYPDGHRTLTKLLHLNPGCNISYQVHSHRDEVWTFVDGEALLVVDGEEIMVGRGYVANIKRGQRHAVKAITHTEIIEVQSGDTLVEEDIRRFPYNF